VLHIIHLLADSNGRSPEPLVETAKALYKTRLRNVRILVPVITSLTKGEVISVLPKLVS